jgi:predicted ester cyclase
MPAFEEIGVKVVCVDSSPTVDAAGQFFSEDMVEQVLFPGQGPGLQGLKDILRDMWAAFPDMNWSLGEQIAEGDKVLTRFE